MTDLKPPSAEERAKSLFNEFCEHTEPGYFDYYRCVCVECLTDEIHAAEAAAREPLEREVERLKGWEQFYVQWSGCPAIDVLEAAREPLEQTLNELHMLCSQGKMVAVERTGDPVIPYRYRVIQCLDSSEQHVLELEREVERLRKELLDTGIEHDSERNELTSRVSGFQREIEGLRERVKLTRLDETAAARTEGRREALDWAVSAACEYHADGAQAVVDKIRALDEGGGEDGS